MFQLDLEQSNGPARDVLQGRLSCFSLDTHGFVEHFLQLFLVATVLVPLTPARDSLLPVEAKSADVKLATRSSGNESALVVFLTWVREAHTTTSFFGSGPGIPLDMVAPDTGPIEIPVVVEAAAFAARLEVIDPEPLLVIHLLFVDHTIGTAIPEIASEVLAGL
jgi:hypothetical protein